MNNKFFDITQLELDQMQFFRMFFMLFIDKRTLIFS
jgi:hypothetical protein